MVDYSSNVHKHPSDFSSIRIQLASPEVILSWSFGEVTKPETINYRSFKPERDGLFCERIFGPVKDWECSCGKYKRIRFRGIVCDRCGVEVTQSKVRRDRMGHIDLAVPVSHIWYFKSLPTRIGYLLHLSVRELERILYYENYIMIDPGNTSYKERDIITEEEYRELISSDKEFEAGMGAEAVQAILKKVDIEELSITLRAQVKVETSVQRKKDTLKRLRVIEAFRQSNNRPDWMIMNRVPVIPPDLRPLVPLEGGRFATSDLNDLYRRVINRNNRLKKLINIRAPEVILRNEKRMLQEAVDALFDNGRRTNSVRGDSKRPLKSLSDLLKGKQGRFRQNLLGKRVDYSGRSVIVVGPELKLHQCGLPKTMALELFKPFIIMKLEEKGYVQTVKSAKKLVEREKPEVWDILEEIISDHPVMLNRAPTLHRLGIQSFYPILVEGKAIKLHPLACAAFNADFDGDQMAVHVPLSFEAQLEARILMLASNNILLPSNGRPVTTPSQDIVIGCHYLTKPRMSDWEKTLRGKDGSEVDDRKTRKQFASFDEVWEEALKEKGKSEVEIEKKRQRFTSFDEVVFALDTNLISLHEWIYVEHKGEIIKTTPGRVLFNDIFPSVMPFFNATADKKNLEELVRDVHFQLGNAETAEFLDKIKTFGFEYATLAGLTVGIDDMTIPAAKTKMIAKAQKDVDKILDDYENGVITNGERYNKVIDIWTSTTNEVAEVMFVGLSKENQGFNPVFMMADSGARSSKEQIRQLAGMRGLMAKPQKRMTGQVGEIIESPIIANFREGLNVMEYFISTHGARKGLADTALKTADAGYLTRRLVDVAQDVIINEKDCDTIMGINISALKDGEDIIESLSDRIVGRVTLEDVYDPIDADRLLIEAGTLIDESAAKETEDAGVDSVYIRSVLTCESRRGVCAKCYGRNLATNKIVQLGEAVGVVAAQSIGEPGTQLTLRTFHIGGTADRITEQSQVTAKVDGHVEFSDEVRIITRKDKEMVAVSRDAEIKLFDTEGRTRATYKLPYAATVRVKDKQKVTVEDVIFEWQPYTNLIVSESNGTIEYEDIVEGVSLREELDEATSRMQLVIIEQREKTLLPKINVIDKNGKKRGSYSMPTTAYLEVRDGEKITAGTTIAKIPRDISKTRDITGGLPRVAELFEVRKPRDPSVVTEIDGVVEYGKIIRGNSQIFVRGFDGETKEYLVPHGKHMRVHGGDNVKAGDRLCEGSVDPHDTLNILGTMAVMEYLVNEVQEVYRLQGVRINDKHFEVIVRQMLQKVQVDDVGDTNFLEGDKVDKTRFREDNERVMAEGGEPATSRDLLLGITRASLSTDSFISAASFQETTKVLTEAAISGKEDTLVGLKENVIIGHLIPAGTGMDAYRDIDVNTIESEEVEEIENEEEIVQENA